jgi:hypothetical protein
MGKVVVGLGRFELPTLGLGNQCSIHLSYSPLINRLLQIYYNAPFAWSSGLSMNFLNSMNTNEKDYISESTQRTGTRVS